MDEVEAIFDGIMGPALNGSFGSLNLFYYEPLCRPGCEHRMGFRISGCYCPVCMTAPGGRECAAVAGCHNDDPWAVGEMASIKTFGGNCKKCEKKSPEGRLAALANLPVNTQPDEFLLKCKLCGFDTADSTYSGNNNVHSFCCKRGLTGCQSDPCGFVKSVPKKYSATRQVGTASGV